MAFFPLAAVNIFVLKGILFFFCAFTFFFGVLFAFSPDTIARMSQWANKVIFAPRDSLPRSKAVGILLILLGGVMTVVLLTL